MKKTIILLIAFLILISDNIYSFADEEPDKTPVFYWSLDAKGIFSSGISDSNLYFKSGGSAGLEFNYLDITAFIYRYFNYQVTDGYGIYENRPVNEAGLSMDAYINNFITLSAEHSMGRDFNDLKKDYYYGGFELAISLITLIADYSYEIFEYQIFSNFVKNNTKSLLLEVDFTLTDSLNLDISYSWIDQYFNLLGYSYYKNIFRIGSIFSPTEFLLLMPGLSAGRDSESYYVIGLDFGISVEFYARIKLSLAYDFAYYYPVNAESVSVSGGGSGGGQTSGTGSGKNPYLSQDKIGESYYSHIASLGISILF